MWCPNSSVFFLFLRVGGKEGCSEGGRGIDNFRQGTVHHRSARTGNQTSRHTVEFNLLFFFLSFQLVLRLKMHPPWINVFG